MTDESDMVILFVLLESFIQTEYHWMPLTC